MKTIIDTPEDFDRYLQKLSKVAALDLNEIYSHRDEAEKELPNDTVGEETNNLNESFNSKKKTLLDTLGNDKKEALIDLHIKKPVDGIRKSITINQRFMFEKDLFNGDKNEFDMVVNYLDNCSTHQEAMDFINENYKKKKNWDSEKTEVIEFYSVINKRFPK
jgi:hypothetical protein